MVAEGLDLHMTQQVDDLLDKAQAAYEADDSTAVTDLCREALDADPNNARAWDLLAKFGGWDAKLYVLDFDFAIDSAAHALGLIPESQRYDAAAEIYTARKKQIAHVLESEMMMPSYTAAKQLHATMMDWKRMLEEIPYLSAALIEGEVTLVNNLCLRSKMGVMPGDRLVYTAYASLNGKESYGDTFQKALDGRLQRERARQEQHTGELLDDVRSRRDALAERVATGLLSPDDEKAELMELLATCKNELVSVEGQSNRVVYAQQLEELERQLEATKSYKVFKRQDLTRKIADTREKAEQLEAELATVTAPLREQVAAIEARLAELG